MNKQWVARDAIDLSKRNSRNGAKAQRKNGLNLEELEELKEHEEPLKRLRNRFRRSFKNMAAATFPSHLADRKVCHTNFE
jgi:hypothetical protein